MSIGRVANGSRQTTAMTPQKANLDVTQHHVGGEYGNDKRRPGQRPAKTENEATENGRTAHQQPQAPISTWSD
jgi:hypothetical protein